MHTFVTISALVATIAAHHLPLDTPEVALAKSQHLAAVEHAKQVHAWSAPAYVSAYYAPTWSTWSAPVVVNGQVQDNPDVAAEKQKHLSILAAEYARHGASLPVVSPVVSQAAAAPIVVANGQVQDLPEVAQAKAEHLAAHAEASARAGIYAAEAPVFAYANPTVVASAPLVAHAAVVPGLQTQYHSQDALGQYSYGYAGGPSSKAESKTVDGVIRGAFTYIDSNGLVQSRSYVADDNGFRVAASDLPVGPSAEVPAPIATPIAVASVPAPAPVIASDTPVVIDAEGHLADTVEVASAKAAHFAAHQEAKAKLANAW